MILDVIFWSFIASLLKKNLKRIFMRNYKLLYLFPVPFALQIIPCCKTFLIPISFALLIYILFENRHIPGFKFMGIGALLNGSIMSICGGRMPVLRSLAESMGLKAMSRHVLMDWNPKLVLGDWIPVYLPYLHRKFIISIGDIFVYIGIAIFFLSRRK